MRIAVLASASLASAAAVTLMTKSQETNSIVVEDVALLRGGQKRGRFDPFDRYPK